MSTVLMDMAEVIRDIANSNPDTKGFDALVRVREETGVSWGDSKEEIAAKLARVMFNAILENDQISLATREGENR